MGDRFLVSGYYFSLIGALASFLFFFISFIYFMFFKLDSVLKLGTVPPEKKNKPLVIWLRKVCNLKMIVSTICASILLFWVNSRIDGTEPVVWHFTSSGSDPIMECRSYLQSYPQGRHVTEVKTRLKTLVDVADQKAWNRASSADKIESYRYYLQEIENNRRYLEGFSEFSMGSHANEARQRLNVLGDKVLAFYRGAASEWAQKIAEDSLGAKIVYFIGNQSSANAGEVNFILERPNQVAKAYQNAVEKVEVIINSEIEIFFGKLPCLRLTTLSTLNPPFSTLTIHCKYSLNLSGLYKSETGNESVFGLSPELIFSIYLPGQEKPELTRSIEVKPDDRMKFYPGGYWSSHEPMEKAIEEDVLKRLQTGMKEQQLAIPITDYLKTNVGNCQ